MFHRINRLIRISSDAATKASFAYEANPPPLWVFGGTRAHCAPGEPPALWTFFEGTSEFAVDTRRAELELNAAPKLFPVSRLFGGLISGKHSLTVLLRPPFNTPVSSGGGIFLPVQVSGPWQGGDFEKSQVPQLLTDSNQTKNDR